MGVEYCLCFHSRVRIRKLHDAGGITVFEGERRWGGGIVIVGRGSLGVTIS